MKQVISRLIKQITIVIFLFLVSMPLCYLITGAIKSTDELVYNLKPIIYEDNNLDQMVRWSMFPNYPTIQHFIKLLFYTPQFFVVFWNSVKLVFWILGGQLVISIPAAWFFVRSESKFSKLLFGTYIILMLMPFQVTMLSNYLVLNKMHLLNTHLAIILPAIFSTFPVFIIYRAFSGIPKELLEASRIDGAGEYTIFFYIGIRLGYPGIAAAFVLGFLEYWNLMEQPLAFLINKSLWPLSLYLPEISLKSTGIAFAASVMTLIPALFVFSMGEDYLEKGIIAAAIKE